ncbi:MAG: hypothetical protein ACLQAT_14585 [Candidatus Binataceae bacterium]
MNPGKPKPKKEVPPVIVGGRQYDPDEVQMDNVEKAIAEYKADKAAKKSEPKPA